VIDSEQFKVCGGRCSSLLDTHKKKKADVSKTTSLKKHWEET